MVAEPVSAPSTSETARGAILARLSGALRDRVAIELPAPLHASEPAGDVASLARRFRDELALLGGQAIFVADQRCVDAAISDFVLARNFRPVADDGSGDYAVVRAAVLVADTGSVVILETSTERRLLPYVPRTCIVAAHVSQLRDTLALPAMSPICEAARSGARGEALIVTGPSRTADIEKTLVLGAHGPASLVVFIGGVPQFI